MNPNKKVNFNYWYKKRDSTIWINADLACMNTQIDDAEKKHCL